MGGDGGDITVMHGRLFANDLLPLEEISRVGLRHDGFGPNAVIAVLFIAVDQC
jgi:hypothetical protein